MEPHALQVVFIKEADFANQEVISDSSVQVVAVEPHALQVVFIKEADSAKQDNLLITKQLFHTTTKDSSTTLAEKITF